MEVNQPESVEPGEHHSPVSQGITVVEFDWNDHMSNVAFSRRVEPEFQGSIEIDGPSVNDVYLYGATEI